MGGLLKKTKKNHQHLVLAFHLSTLIYASMNKMGELSTFTCEYVARLSCFSRKKS